MFRIFLFFVIITSVFSCSKSKPDSKNQSKGRKLVVPVQTIVVRPGILSHTVHATGTILANEEVELRSEVAGRIVKINFQEGQSVQKGQLLIKIEDDELKAQLKKVELQVELANTEENRSKVLLGQNGISRQDYDIVLNRLNTYKADAEFIQAQIRKTAIVAPFSGSIGLRYVSEGSYVSASTLLATLLQSDPVKIEFAIPEKFAASVKQGNTISFTTQQEKKYTARVYANDQKIDFDTRSIKVRARTSNPKKELIPGSFVKVDLQLEQIKDAITLPAEAVVPVLAGQVVYLYKSGKAHTAKILTGIRSDTEVQVLKGLNPGDTVITTGIMMLRDGSPVQLQSVK